MMMKRAGQGHDPAGSDATGAGELALECPACPQPDINLPENWEQGSGPEKYMFAV
jgi:hypothetical protein